MGIAPVSTRVAPHPVGADVEEIHIDSGLQASASAASDAPPLTHRASWLPMHNAFVTFEARANHLFMRERSRLSEKQTKEMQADVRTALAVLEPLISVFEVLSCASALQAQGAAKLLRKRCPPALEQARKAEISLEAQGALRLLARHLGTPDESAKKPGVLPKCWRAVKISARFMGRVAYAVGKLLWLAGRAVVRGTVWTWRKLLGGKAKTLCETALMGSQGHAASRQAKPIELTKKDLRAQLRLMRQDLVAFCVALKPQMEMLQTRAETYIDDATCEQLCVQTRPSYAAALRVQASLTVIDCCL